ncbi:hypothetical protein CDL15_Pgr017261 [Punica granatum]|uniref:Transcription factor Iwr1 domain-containing protein n=1 Tax=Punica granatum TaxID=22663 RepID=A0A218WQP9_PUNGR|nr:hypothetical protein CDL15_Pgr017261 [Punica granatum]
METDHSGSSGPKDDDKPLIVRVKRKASHSLLDAFWLEINERPLKRPLLDFEKLSISGSSGKEEELRTKRVLVKHVETRGSSVATFELFQSFMPTCSEGSESKTRNEERKSTFRGQNIREKLLSKARESKEVLAKNARFEQIWSRRGKKLMKDDKALHEIAVSLEDQRMLSSYLPLLREFIPDAAVKIESDLHAHASRQGAKDDYVYDYYVMQDDGDMIQEDAFNALPLVQVDDADDFYDGPDSDYETDDSNAENNPLNDYPDETSDEEETESGETDSELEEGEEKEEEESASSTTSGEDIDRSFEDEDGFDVDEDYFEYGDGDSDAEDCRWSH